MAQMSEHEQEGNGKLVHLGPVPGLLDGLEEVRTAGTDDETLIGKTATQTAAMRLCNMVLKKTLGNASVLAVMMKMKLKSCFLVLVLQSLRESCSARVARILEVADFLNLGSSRFEGDFLQMGLMSLT